MRILVRDELDTGPDVGGSVVEEEFGKVLLIVLLGGRSGSALVTSR